MRNASAPWGQPYIIYIKERGEQPKAVFSLLFFFPSLHPHKSKNKPPTTRQLPSMPKPSMVLPAVSVQSVLSVSSKNHPCSPIPSTTENKSLIRLHFKFPSVDWQCKDKTSPHPKSTPLNSIECLLKPHWKIIFWSSGNPMVVVCSRVIKSLSAFILRKMVHSAIHSPYRVGKFFLYCKVIQ